MKTTKLIALAFALALAGCIKEDEPKPTPKSEATWHIVHRDTTKVDTTIIVGRIDNEIMEGNDQ